jgi:hypothetical protein
VLHPNKRFEDEDEDEHEDDIERANTSCYLSIPTRGFTAVVSVFMGTPPPKPLNCKFRQNRFGAATGGL